MQISDFNQLAINNSIKFRKSDFFNIVGQSTAQCSIIIKVQYSISIKVYYYYCNFTCSNISNFYDF